MYHLLDDKLHEECGVFGVRSTGSDVASIVYTGLYALQHRGQESCGIAINDDGVITGHKGLGLVSEVFSKDVLEKLPGGNMAIGHCRYSTTGGLSVENAQPLVIRHIKGTMAIAHNGNLTNAAKLKEELELTGAIFHTTSDTEVIAHTIIRERLVSDSIEEAISRAMTKIQGAYSLVIMSPKKLIAVRDPLGFRPLCIGKAGEDYIVASESCALDSVGASFIRDVNPGEIVIIDEEGMRSIEDNCKPGKKSACVFEFIYFARPDSVIDGSGVHTARLRAGAFLALEHPVQADVVIGVPDSGIDAALGYSKQSGIPYDVGFIKNKYIGRTFIEPFQPQRESALRIKLNTISSTVRGKRVILIDDSIVRGTTSKRIVRLLREAGAKEVHMRVSSPPFLYPCFFGTDIRSREHLIAANHTVEEIAEIIGVDSLGFLGVENVTKLADNPSLEFCTSCFTGRYPIEVPEIMPKEKYEFTIGENLDLSQEPVRMEDK
ncbi:MAG TPA: amidophosphoribosyltransferase [Bacillota bacterium]|jgi:amidophosphoribosyltransferase|nr:amidophosphoribosyltransferase [Bacillota bacterium]HQC82416.1 amidophosphoribosyltransferase [Bacillota bacterium]